MAKRNKSTHKDNGKSRTKKFGHLVVIGGGEDKTNDKEVLARVVQLSGGEQANLVILTSASSLHEEMREIYEKVFAALGVKHKSALAINSREEANNPESATKIFEADAIFMTGGDQKRLLAMIGGTNVARAMHRAFREHGACIAGTSAGASAMAEHMFIEGAQEEPPPQKDMATIAVGLGFLPRVLIDQHFSQRKRLGRLLSVVAQNPYLLGIGIDEDTAMIIEPNTGIEVIGEGSVTILDGRHMVSNLAEIESKQRLELLNVILHLLPAGCRYYLEPHQSRTPSSEGKLPDHMHNIVSTITSVH